jgi:hypothetical protein
MADWHAGMTRDDLIDQGDDLLTENERLRVLLLDTIDLLEDRGVHVECDGALLDRMVAIRKRIKAEVAK